MNAGQIRELSARVQHNCHISDARHGGDYQLCTFLMKMREYYRWEMGLPLGARLPKDQVGAWLAEREQYWEQIEEDDYLPLEIDGAVLDPFAVEPINQRLETVGLVYGAGLGRHAKPHFFLAQLRERQRPDGCQLVISDREYARDLGAPPAMSQGDTIYLRRESLRRLLWEKLESWRWNRPDNALGRAFACYDFDGDLDASLDAMTDLALDVARLHELGECQAGRLLGEGWEAMLLDLVGTPAEILARAVRDHLADCLVSLPVLIQEDRAAAWHFYVGYQTPLGRELFPSLERAYQDWLVSGDLAALTRLASVGRDHWERLARRLMERHGAAEPGAAADINRWVRESAC